MHSIDEHILFLNDKSGMESHLNVLHCMMCLVTGESTHVDAIKMFYTQSAQRRGEEKDLLLAGSLFTPR